MGGKYEIRYYTCEDDFLPYQSEYTNSFINFVKIMIKNRKKLIYFTIRFKNIKVISGV
jgi:hypothetical protein